MELTIFSDEHFMKKAIEEAHKAEEMGEVPIGAVVVCKNKIIGKGFNQIETLNDVTAHAEMLAITAASNYLGSKYLKDCKLYVTLEPCAMCATAINHSQLAEVVYGAKDSKRGYSNFTPALMHPKALIKREYFEEECARLLKDFFKSKRKK